MPTGVDWIPIVAIVMGTLTVLVPLSLVTLRFAIKPIAEAVAHMRSSGAAQEELAIMRQRLSLLEQQFAGIETEVERIAEAQDFQAELLSPGKDA
jgi:biopolymer transport protein ExbB/TolQ